MEQQVIELVQYIDIDEDVWEGDEEEVCVLEQRMVVLTPPVKRRSSSITVLPHEVGIGCAAEEEIVWGIGSAAEAMVTEENGDECQEEEEELCEEERQIKAQLEAEIAELDRQIEELMKIKTDNTCPMKRNVSREDSLTSITSPCSETDDCEAMIEMKIPRDDSFDSFTTGQRSETDECDAMKKIWRDDSLTSYTTSQCSETDDCDAMIGMKKIWRDDSFTSFATTTQCSDTDEGETDLDSYHPLTTRNKRAVGFRASIRMSVVDGKAVHKVRKRFISAKLRDRLRYHAHLQNKGGLDIFWKEINREIKRTDSKKKLKLVPKSQRRDSSTWVNQDHPFMRELKDVQTDVLPVWRKEIYSYWI